MKPWDGEDGTVASGKLLIIEDDEDSQYVYRTYLEHKGFEVTGAQTGEEGLRMARAALPDVILMDISMPGMDGWEITRRLKADASTRDIPVIAITAHAFPEDREKSREVGCEGFLTKPCDPKDVLTEIERALSS